MNKIFKDIDSAKHIMIVADAKTLAPASALYTHILMLHKKVSLVCQTQDIENNFASIPWFDKIRGSKTTSADCVIELSCGAIELYNYFKINNIKINLKMATALYVGLLQESDCFLASGVDGTIFAMAKELVDCGVEHKVCVEMLKQTTLASLRLKASLFKKMILKDDARVAIFELDAQDLKATGASLKDCESILKESLNIPYIDQAILLDKDKEYEMLRLKIKEK